MLSKVSGKKRMTAYWRLGLSAGAVIGFLMTITIYAGLYKPVVEPVYNHIRTISLSASSRIPHLKPLPPYQSKFDASNDLFGWQDTADEVQSILQRMPHPHRTFVFTHRFFEASQLAVYLPSTTVMTTLGKKIDQYRLWFDPAAHEGWDALFVDIDRRRQGPDRYLPLFKQVQPRPEVLQVNRDGRQIRTIRLYRYISYRGGYQN